METLLGRRRYLPHINSADAKERARAERQAANTVCQGSAADLLKLAATNVASRYTFFTFAFSSILCSTTVVYIRRKTWDKRLIGRERPPPGRSQAAAVSLNESLPVVALKKDTSIVYDSPVHDAPPHLRLERCGWMWKSRMAAKESPRNASRDAIDGEYSPPSRFSEDGGRSELARNPACRLVLSIHDELLYEVRG